VNGAARKIVGIALMALAPLAVHFAITSSKWTPFIVAIPVVQVLVLVGMAVIRDRRRIRWLGPIAALFVLLVLWAVHSGASLTAMAGIPHAVAYISLLLPFGYTLLPGQEAILTQIVNAVRGPLPPELVAHTRHVTVAWFCFFAVQLLASVVLYLTAPLETWSFFINVLNLPLLLLMFIIEGLYRALRFRDFPMDSMSDIVRILSTATGRRARQADVA
jgi:uncharacterized membrane protein